MIAIQYTLAADSTIQGLGSGKTAAASIEPVHDVSGAGDMVKDMVTDQSDSNGSYRARGAASSLFLASVL